jgi:alkanesulfonate monooxygenase SsuD/methylene tetrahydromethanopterin reductase-like flavin-dependent oxidoreductase (luciferase family)
MLTERLTLLKAMWAGKAIQHGGPHYQVNVAATEPEPHRIPVWMASSVNHPEVISRAAGCDGIFPNPEDHELAPEEIAGIHRELRRAGLPADRPFDIAVRGNASPAWQEDKNVDLTGLAQAGMTWWLESLIHFDPLNLSMEVVDAGPPRVSHVTPSRP